MCVVGLVVRICICYVCCCGYFCCCWDEVGFIGLVMMVIVSEWGSGVLFFWFVGFRFYILCFCGYCFICIGLDLKFCIEVYCYVCFVVIMDCFVDWVFCFVVLILGWFFCDGVDVLEFLVIYCCGFYYGCICLVLWFDV